MVAFDRNPQDFKYLRLLSRQFPTEQSAFTEIMYGGTDRDVSGIY